MAKEFILSDGRKNNKGFKINMEKLDLSAFNENPVMLHVHNYSEQLGTWENLRVEEGVLYGTPKFFEGDASNDLVKLMHARVESGGLKGASVGLEYPSNITFDDEGNPVLETAVLEASIVPVPSNRGCLAKIYGKQGEELSAEDFQLTIEEYKKPIEIKTEMKINEISRQALGLSADASEEQINAAIKNMSDANTKAHNELKALNGTKVKNLIDSAIEEGRITKDEESHYTELASEKFDLAKSAIEKLPKKEDLPPREHTLSAGGSEDRSKWTYREWAKNDTEGLLQLKAEQPEEYAKLYAKRNS